MKVYIKVKASDEKKWSFLTSNGGTTYLKIHAATWEKSDAEKMIQENAPDNPDFSWKIQEVAS